MAKVRTLSDLKKEDEEAQLLHSGSNSPSESEALMNQGYAVNIIEMIFPYFTWKSSLLLFSMVQLSVYIASLIKGSEFILVPSVESLLTFGANYPPLIAKGEIWRLFLPIFLHASFLHILFNVFFQLRMGFGIERKYGIARFCLLYLLSGITGNLFSAVTFFCELKVGASTSGFGLIGLELAELAISWRIMRHRERILINMALYIFISSLLIFSLNGGHVDLMGHLGGLIAGLCLAIIFNYNMENKPYWYTISFYSSIAILITLYSVCIPLIFVLERKCKPLA